MKANYNTVMAKILATEGGLSNDPKDPGGRTMKGVTQRVYDAYRSNKGLDAQDVALISQDELSEIYATQYATPIRFGDLPNGVDYAVLDYAINSGPEQASKDLQRVLGAVVDGVIGQATLAAANAESAVKIVNDLCDRRLAFMKSLKNWEHDKDGWKARVAKVRNDACALIQPTEPAAVDPEAPGVAKALPANQAQLKTTTGVGALIAGSGLSGQTIVTAAEQVKPHIGDTLLGRLALLAFVLLMLSGAGLLAYDYYNKWQEKRQ